MFRQIISTVKMRNGLGMHAKVQYKYLKVSPVIFQIILHLEAGEDSQER